MYNRHLTYALATTPIILRHQRATMSDPISAIGGFLVFLIDLALALLGPFVFLLPALAVGAIVWCFLRQFKREK